MNLLANIQHAVVFKAIKAFLASLGPVVALTPTPWDNLGLATIKGIVDILEQATTKQEALAGIANLLPDDEPATTV